MAWTYGACLAVVAASVELKTVETALGPPNPGDTGLDTTRCPSA
eukprot:CAMPEP_0182586604 /NCGR_PEP_ID=MMETSP1324-20130603/63035_1 /TAXON_ID=236786 /ORGANISM="Florenciella sp., Strain RCC1587" /LENGTH=43 /DNA_ID= /DNA_START= /DNA_END= /DNA_ORIENTATION=